MGRGAGNPRDVLLSKRNNSAALKSFWNIEKTETGIKESLIDANGKQIIRSYEDRGEIVGKETQEGLLIEKFIYRDPNLEYDPIGDSVVVETKEIRGPQTIRRFCYSDGSYLIRSLGEQENPVVYEESLNPGDPHRIEIFNWETENSVIRKDYLYEDGIRKIHNYLDGALQSFDGEPSVSEMTDLGEPILKSWHEKGKLYRSPKNSLAEEAWDDEGRLIYQKRTQKITVRGVETIVPGSPDSQPAYIDYFEDYEPNREYWFNFYPEDDDIAEHADDFWDYPDRHSCNFLNQPSSTVHDEFGREVSVIYRCGSDYHRTNGPAVISLDDEETYEEFYWHGKRCKDKAEWETLKSA